MFIPEPFPDEFAYGHVGRITYLNGHFSIRCTERALKQFVRLKQRGAPWLAYAAKACRFTEDEYANRHTIVPLMKTVHRLSSDRLGRPPAQIMLRKAGTLSRYSAGAFCAQCANEDARQYGVAFWRRSHCLPGIDWCVKHGVRLGCDERPDCYKFPPERSHQGDDHPVAKLCPLIARYASIMQSFLAGAKSVLLQHARHALVEHMAIWAHHAPMSSSRSLELRVVPALPPPWDFLRLGHIAPLELDALDRDAEEVIRRASAFDVGAYGLALAMAFRTTSDAMAFHSAVKPVPLSERHREGVVDWDFWSRAGALRSSKHARPQERLCQSA